MGSPASQPATKLRRKEAREGPYVLELPISKQFTPNQIRSLQAFLKIVKKHGPEGGGTFADARLQVKKQLFSDQRRGGSEEKRVTAAGNAISSARHWGLLNEETKLTPLGTAVLAAADDDVAARLLVEHFLRHLGGAQTAKALIDVIRANDDVAPEKTTLATALHGAGIYENRDGTDHSAVLAWLSHPGVGVAEKRSGGRWIFDDARFQQLAGVAPAAIDAVARRDPVQLAILTELARMSKGESDAGTMQQILKARTDLDVSAPGFRKKYLDPLQQDGLIKIGARAGRGATQFSITKLGRSEAVADLVARFDADGVLNYQPGDLLRPTSAIVRDLNPKSQPSKHRRGVALEHLALRLLDRLGLKGPRWRVRPGQAEEIDGTAYADVPAFALWQVQAKNTTRLDADDAAKEVGLAVVNGAAVVMLITTGSFTQAARSIVERAEGRSGLVFVCLDGDDVSAVAKDPTSLSRILDREASRSKARRELATG